MAGIFAYHQAGTVLVFCNGDSVRLVAMADTAGGKAAFHMLYPADLNPVDDDPDGEKIAAPEPLLPKREWLLAA